VDRELVFAGLAIIIGGLTLLVAAPWPQRIARRTSARQWERAAWRALWWPSLPVVLVISVLIGWALMEPATSDEPLPGSALVFATIVLALWLRAAVRAVRALQAQARTPLAAGTIGLWRTRIVVSAGLAAQLDVDALAAVMAHERAHVRHRDPLRIWLAQIVTDLQWPWPAARERFDAWRQILELARDEEARLGGAEGDDLAAAVLLVAHMQAPCTAAATLIDTPCGIEERISRLLAPVATEDEPVTAPHMLALASLSLLGVVSGIRFGDSLVQTIVKWL
jgi:hypothetical protein